MYHRYAIQVDPDVQYKVRIAKKEITAVITREELDFDIGSEIVLFDHRQVFLVLADVVECFHMVFQELLDADIVKLGFHSRQAITKHYEIRYQPNSPITLVFFNRVRGFYVDHPDAII